jgi:hypothetical protein
MVQTKSRTSTANRKPRAKRTDSVGELKGLVNRLIAENRKLKTQIQRTLEKPSGVAPRALATLARKAERALAGTTAVTAKRRKPTTPSRPVSPETAMKRRQALAKARQVMAEKRAVAAAARA